MIKRVLDVTLAGLALIILSPLCFILAGLVAFKMGRPVLFAQQRPGLNAEPFIMYKFRSMRDAADEQGTPLADDQRLTNLGKFLRTTSLDELPELWNVLRGDMSLVGPRPLLMSYLPLYSKDQARRHTVRPGITGWAQINGRNALTWEEKFKLDIWYVDNRTFWIDVRILVKTLMAVFTRHGINYDGHVTMPPFEGCGSETK